MGNIDLGTVFKQTTSKRIKCKMCSSSVDGEDGYIKINFYSREYGWSGHNIEKRIVVCNKCFNKWLGEITIARKNKKELYDKMVKTKILKSLK